VKLGLTIHRVVPAHVIDVEVCKGPVAVPDSAYERLHAKSVISRLPAVGFSENKLDVRRSWALKTDGGIRRDIVTRLWSDRLIVARSIDVTVEDGVATLTGTVDTWTELLDAISKALDAGATKVRDRLKLEGAPRRYQR
jgi:osmotically-inducible protein OsmY